jgi:hypothetical protein
MPICIGKASVLQPSRIRVMVLLLMKLPTNLTIHSEIFLPLGLCSCHSGIILSKAAISQVIAV